MPAAATPPQERQRLEALCDYRLEEGGDARLDDVVSLAARLAGTPMAMVSFVEADFQHLVARHGLPIERTPREVAFCAHAILQPDRPLLVPDTRADARFADNPLVHGPPGLRAYLGVPLVTPAGEALGALSVLDVQPRSHDPATVETIQALARIAVTTLELHRAMRRVKELALTDALTGLPNRIAFLEALSRAIARQRRDGAPFSVLYLDLDGFKSVNDRAGHAAGDAALAALGRLLRGTARRQDLPARLGGDEFALLLAERDGKGAARVGQRVCLAIAGAMAGQGVTASVGGVVFHEPPADENAALAAVDAMMFSAKREGGNGLRWRESGRPHLLRAG